VLIWQCERRLRRWGEETTPGETVGRRYRETEREEERRRGGGEEERRRREEKE
jgi:hypothetical protein